MLQAYKIIFMCFLKSYFTSCGLYYSSTGTFTNNLIFYSVKVLHIKLEVTLNLKFILKCHLTQ